MNGVDRLEEQTVTDGPHQVATRDLGVRVTKDNDLANSARDSAYLLNITLKQQLS
jgi:hypothetical protein